MDAILLLAVVGCFIWLMARKGAFSAAGQPAPVEPTARPIEQRRDDHQSSADPGILDGDLADEDEWPPDDSPRWRLGKYGRPTTGGDGMMIVSGGDSGGGC